MRPLPCARLLLLVAAAWAAAAWPAAAARDLVKRDPVPTDQWRYPEPKYFKEAFYHAHYDARFMVEPLEEAPHREAIRVLIQTYLATCRELGVQTWLMHGSLLGWWWGKKVMPWDFDADVQVTEGDMYFLAAYYNMTVYYYKYASMQKGRYFLLDINPHFAYRERDDALNFIDARWVDMESGLFIDITAARYDPKHEAGQGMLYDKNEHEYRDTYLFPLRDTTFEGVPAKIPFRYKEMLESEYGKDALTNSEFHQHVFDKDEMQWVIAPKNRLYDKRGPGRAEA